MTRTILGLLCCVTLLSFSQLEANDVAQDTTRPSNVGPQVGSVVPDFSGLDQFGRTQTLQGVLGVKGAMLVFFRSADW